MSSTTVQLTNEINWTIVQTNERTNQKKAALVKCNIGAGSFSTMKQKNKKQSTSNEDCENVAKIELNPIENTER